MTAPTQPPALAAMSPSMTFANHHHFIYHDLHLNIWGPFESMDQAVKVSQTVLHERGHPSRIVLPIIPR